MLVRNFSKYMIPSVVQGITSILIMVPITTYYLDKVDYEKLPQSIKDTKSKFHVLNKEIKIQLFVFVLTAFVFSTFGVLECNLNHDSVECLEYEEDINKIINRS